MGLARLVLVSFYSVVFAQIAVAGSTIDSNSDLTLIKILKDEYGRLTKLSEQKINTSSRSDSDLTISEYPQFIVEHAPVQAAKIIELRSRDKRTLDQWLKAHNVTPIQVSLEDSLVDEVRTIVNSGPATNRIDLVFMGDGYTTDEREKFFSDIARLVNDMFVGKTFASYLPLFNVHAVFRASSRSGIGRGSPIDTAYGLYREGETLRAILPGKPSAIRESCRQAPGCDYPVVIANDPYYGGLGGEFAISTSSITSGTVVLRHELGHNFGRVGEEYDGGGYFGANHSTSANNPSWIHWATNRNALKAEPMVARYLDWPWYRLDKGPFTINLASDGNYSRALVRLSASGIETPDTLSIQLNNQNLAFESPNRLDRAFIEIALPGLLAGSHSMTFTENVHDRNNWISSLKVYEYAEDFHDQKDYVGAYPNFDKSLRLDGFRPTNESCLMRDMTHEFFCPVCQENNWSNFFDNVDLIDSATAVITGNKLNAEVKTLKLAPFPSGSPSTSTGRLEIIWTADGRELTQFRDQTAISFDFKDKPQTMTVNVRFTSSEIRKRVVSSQKALAI